MNVIRFNLIQYITIAIIIYEIISIIANSFNPSQYQFYLGVTILLSIFSVIGINFGKKYNFQSNICYIILYQLYISALLLIIFYVYAKNFLGFNPIDSKHYYEITLFTSKLNNEEFWNYLTNGSDLSNFSDWGFPFILHTIFKLCGSTNITYSLLSIVNIICHLITTIYVYKISMLFFNKQDTKIIYIIWGYNLLSSYFIVSGLKEVIFTLLTVLATYYLLKLCFYKINSINILYFVSSIILTLFFRYYVTIFFLIVFFELLLINRIINRLFIPYLITIICGSLILLHLFVSIMPELYYVINSNHESNNLPTGLSGGIIKTILAFIGPFPKIDFNSLSNDYLFSSFIITKFYLSPFFLISIFKILKEKIYKYYLLINLYILNSMMLVVTDHFFNIRFMILFLPIYLIIAYFGYKYSTNLFKYLCLALCSCFLIIYNTII